MFRIDGATAAPSLPAPASVSGTPGYFTPGDPAVPTPPTIVTPDWLNTVQEELMAILIEAGVTPDKSNHGQVLVAIKLLITAGAAWASDAEAIAGLIINKALTPHSGAALVQAKINALVNAAPGSLDTLKELADALGDDPNFAATVNNAIAARALASRKVLGGGLATGGGDLSADRTINVAAASGADLNAGTATDKALTPAAYAAGGGGTWQRGWSVMPGGFIKQWGSETITGTGSSAAAVAITFPVPFTQGCNLPRGNCDPYLDGAGSWHPMVAVFNPPNLTGCTGWIDATDPSKTFNNTHTLSWEVIGK